MGSQASDGTAVFYFSRSDQQPGEDLTSIPVTFTLIPKSGDTYLSSNVLVYTATIPTLKKMGSYQPVKIAYSKFKPTINGYVYVDMGTGVKWATMNVGANKPEEYGDYFAWGETDAATQNWGGTWRMPTFEEWDKLARTKENSDYNWTWCDGTDVQYNNSNVPGYKIERKSTGATLFLPAAGYINSTLHNVESGYYWSSSRHPRVDSYVYYLLISRNTVSVRDQGIIDEGYSVRPVSD